MLWIKNLPRPIRIPLAKVMVLASMCWLFAGSLTAQAAGDNNVPQVVATTKPLHSLVAAVTHGVSEPALLISGNASPHTFQLKPSHLRRMAKADVVVWAGPGVEGFMSAVLKTVTDKTVVLEMAAIPGMVLHRSRGRGHAHIQALEHSQRHTDEHTTEDRSQKALDFHLWLNPTNAVLLVEKLVLELSAIDQVNAARYQANGQAYKVQISNTLVQMKTILDNAAEQPYLIYHDSLQYFEKAFGLGPAMVVTDNPQVQPGARRIKELQNALASGSHHCIISEPQFRAPMLTMLIDELRLQSIVVDPVAAHMQAGPELYTDWMLQIANVLSKCALPVSE